MSEGIITVHLYLESAFRNEDFHHAVEHRFFEHEAIRDFENEEHTSISAFAHVTGIYFKIVTQKWSSGEIFKTIESVLSGDIPPFSKEEAARFESELRERKRDEENDLVESSTFKKELESPVLENASKFSDFVIRRSAVVCEGADMKYFETRHHDTPSVRPFGKARVEGSGTEFHLVFFHLLGKPEDSLYEAIHTEFVRTYLKNRFVKDGGSYDIWSSLYNEAGYSHAGHYWQVERKVAFSFETSDIEIDRAEFEHFKKVVAFDTKVGCSQGHYALNAIVGLDPKKESEALESLNYEGFLEFLKSSGGGMGLDCR